MKYSQEEPAGSARQRCPLVMVIQEPHVRNAEISSPRTSAELKCSQQPFVGGTGRRWTEMLATAVCRRYS
jgi:hypothetical protein